MITFFQRGISQIIENLGKSDVKPLYKPLEMVLKKTAEEHVKSF
jgi:hypothetical protein